MQNCLCSRATALKNHLTKVLTSADDRVTDHLIRDAIVIDSATATTDTAIRVHASLSGSAQ